MDSDKLMNVVTQLNHVLGEQQERSRARLPQGNEGLSFFAAGQRFRSVVQRAAPLRSAPADMLCWVSPIFWPICGIVLCTQLPQGFPQGTAGLYALDCIEQQLPLWHLK